MESGFWDTMYSTLLQHYLQKHITQDARKPNGFDENDDMFQLLTCCKYKKTLLEIGTIFANIPYKTGRNCTSGFTDCVYFCF